MSFTKKDVDGKIYRYKNATIDCSKDKTIVEQSHKKEVDINNIVKRAGSAEMIAKTALLQTPEYRFDDLPGNDFMEAHLILAKAEQSFGQLDSATRAEFNNEPARFLDYVQNPENKDKLIERGWANPPEPEPTPVEVLVTNPETPPSSEA